MKSFNQEASNLLLKKPTDHTYSGKHFQSPELVWKDFIPYQGVKRAIQIFRYFRTNYLLLNVLYLNKMLYKFGKIVSRVLFDGRNSNPNTSFLSLYTSKLFVESAKAVIRTRLVTPPSLHRAPSLFYLS